MTAKHPLILAFIRMVLPPVAVTGLLFLLSYTDTSLAVYFLCLWGLFPAACILPSFLSGKQGLHPFLCTVPGFLLMLLPLPGALGAGLCGVVLGLVACVAGQEWQKQKNPSRRKHHG
ncbi:MAG: hypothetical protein IJB69_04425 [Clostridia bacterium]|nr:hypothetical protein [Clostridia bacterium]